MTTPPTTSTGRRGYVTAPRSWVENTAALSESAFRLFLWLESHTDEFLRSVDVSKCAARLNWSRARVRRNLDELEAVGLVSTAQVYHAGSGSRTLITLHLDRWTEGPTPVTPCITPPVTPCITPLQHRVTPPLAHGVTPTTSTTSSEERSTETPPQLALLGGNATDVVGSPAPTFDEWYARYPRKTARRDAERMWARLTAEQKRAALDTIDAHVAHWHREGRSSTVVPYPATWLNRHSWEDELTFVQGNTARREAPGMTAIRNRLNRSNP